MAADTAELMSHVKDADSFHLPFGRHIDLPNYGTVEVLPSWNCFGWFDVPALEIQLKLTKFMVLEVVAAHELDVQVAIMLDTRGVEIRTGRLHQGSAMLTTGAPFVLYTDGRIGDAAGVSVSYALLPEEVSPGTKILLDDGVAADAPESVANGPAAAAAPAA